MWILNTDTNQWVRKTDGLSKDNYDNLKQDLSKTKLYSKTLSGSNYLSTNNTDNIYESITYKDYKSWFVNPVSSIYNTVGSIPANGASIDKTTLVTYGKYLTQYGFTLKNLFTPEKAIEDTNFIQIDVATTQQIIVSSAIIIDNIKLIEGQIVLVKNQTSTIDLEFSVDPNVYFSGNYYLVSNNVADSTYYYYTNENGIYSFTNGKLIRTIIDYNGLSVYVKLGSNADKQFSVLRLNNGYYPEDGEVMEFIDSHNYLVRHQSDYHDLYENNYTDILKHGTQSIVVNNFTYTIPERLIYVGDFGIILNKQGGTYSQYLYNDYKYNLKSITEVGAFYWVCGDEGSILKISKIDFSITKIDLGKEFKTFTSISFLNELRGIAVGKYNTIYYTIDGGYNWSQLLFAGTEEYSYNRVLYYSYNTVYISGDNGVFLELNYSDLSSSKWSLIQRNIIKNLTATDEYELIEDINDMYYTNFFGATTSNNWILNYPTTGVGISTSKDCLFLVTNNNNIIIYEINNFVPEHNFLYLSFSYSFGDITSITRQSNTNNIIISGNDVISFNINNFGTVSTISNQISATTYSVLNSDYNNRIFDYKGIDLYNVGNVALVSDYNYATASYLPINNEVINPKLVIMDYDMADKLNFFDSNYNYRLPTSITFSSNVSRNTDRFVSIGHVGVPTYSVYTIAYTDPNPSNPLLPIVPIVGSIVNISVDNPSYSYYNGAQIVSSAIRNATTGLTTFVTNRLYTLSGATYGTVTYPLPTSVKLSQLDFNSYPSTWLDYLIDSKKTYGVNSNLANPIILSTTFSTGTFSCTFSSASISLDFNDMSNLYPIVNSTTQSRYTQFIAATPSNSYNVFIYKYAIIFKLPNTFCSVGDTLQISSDNIEATVIINYTFGGYYYAFNDLNEAILNSIKSSSVLTINNLNKFLTFTDLLNNFESHPISDGYKLSYSNTVSSVGTILTSTLVDGGPTGFTAGMYASIIAGDGSGIAQILTTDSHGIVLTYTIISGGLGYTASSVVHVQNNLVGYFTISIDSVGLSLFTVDPRFNNLTAYKSLESKVLGVYSLVTIENDILYPTKYNQFGYTPYYSLLNYLSTINPVFTSSKKFYAMPEYSNIPGNAAGTFTPNNIYYDSNAGSTYLKNKIIFGKNLKYEFDTLWLNTFVDVTINGSYTKTLLIIKKYYDISTDGYAMIFSDKVLDLSNTPVNTISIISRNTLTQISSDLALFNTINKPLLTNTDSFNFYDNPIKTKLNTDSYTKILLSDGDIKKYVTSIIYTDADYKLAMNVVNINTTRDISINDTFNYSSNLALNIVSPHHINGSRLSYINFTGATGSSTTVNPSYIGMHTISPIDDYNLSVNTPYLSLTSIQDIGMLRISDFDPFFNYQPIDILDIGVDSMYKIPVELSEINLVKDSLTASLVNFTQNKAVFRLIDGLDINIISTKYHWILEAEISDAIIGLDANGIVWYSGTWHSGRWFGGTWYSGTWISGDWYAGTWYSYTTTDKVNTVTVGKTNVSNSNSVWYNGRWFDGNWNGGTWMDGRWYAGTWVDGLWFNGIWNGGSWLKGTFAGGIWVQGYWDNGIFNSSNKPSYWINGKFYSGDFQNGMWYNGHFGENYKVLSQFGSLATNSRNATWHGGVWASGNFYSHINIDTSGIISTSISHKYSTWKTGSWNQGNFYGGVVYNIEFQNGHWYGGITKDIEIIGVSNPLLANEITLNGIFRFNIGDYINILNNGSSNPYINLGNDSNPGRYRVALVRFDLINNWTIVTLDYKFSSLSFTAPYNSAASLNVNTGLKFVSKFKNITWDTGVWGNGIFEGGVFNGGVWYNGVLTSGEWGF